MNGEVCCILGVCCPPPSPEALAEGGDKRAKALAKEMVKDGIVGEEKAQKVADWIFKHFDLAEAGTLQPFVASIAKHAKKEGR